MACEAGCVDIRVERGQLHLECGKLLPEIVMQFPRDIRPLVFPGGLNVSRQFAGMLEFREAQLIGHVARYLGKAAQRAICVTYGCDHDICPEAGFVFANSPPFVFDMPLFDRQRELCFRLARCDILRRIKDRKVPAYDFVRFIAFDPFRAVVPGGDLSGGVEKKDRIVFHCFDQQTEMLVAQQAANRGASRHSFALVVGRPLTRRLIATLHAVCLTDWEGDLVALGESCRRSPGAMIPV